MVKVIDHALSFRVHCSWYMNFPIRKSLCWLEWCFATEIERKLEYSHHELIELLFEQDISSKPSCILLLLLFIMPLIFYFFLKWEDISFCYRKYYFLVILSFKWIIGLFLLFLFYYWKIWVESEIGFIESCLVLRFAVGGIGRFLLALMNEV